jgi:peptidoglycan/xylan/chitin deacetylase (PgdA/CDA1 family)
VVYHSVSAGPPPRDIPGWHLVTVQRFRRQIEYLARHYEILPLDEAIDALARGAIRRNTACLTFDDGYANNFTQALPILQQFSAPATIYLATGLIGTERRLWTLRLETALRRSPIQRIDLSSIGVGVLALNGLSDRVLAAHAAIRVIKRLTVGERETALARIHSQLPDDGADRSGEFRMMSWSEAAAMENTGLVRFGAHTVNHELVAFLDDQTLEAELRQSIAEVRSRFRHASQTFAYPNGGSGDFDERAIELLRAAGVKAAVTTLHGLNQAATDRFRLRRVTVDGYTSFDRFRVITSGMGFGRPAWMRR